jgi:hypothetical protein
MVRVHGRRVPGSNTCRYGSNPSRDIAAGDDRLVQVSVLIMVHVQVSRRFADLHSLWITSDLNTRR